jgi:DivIVA domain-containing protein
MIDLTPLDVRNKRGDFKRLLRGYDPEEVDIFLELVAERLEGLVRETIKLRERTEMLTQQVNSQSGREQAVQEALVSAQELRADIRGQAEREAGLVLKEAESAARHKLAEAEAEARAKLRETERQLEQGRAALEELDRSRKLFLRAYRHLLERELDVVAVEEERVPMEEHPVDLDLGGSRVRDDDEEAGEEPPPTDEEDFTGFGPTEADESEGVQPPIDALVDRLAEVYDELPGSDAPAEPAVGPVEEGSASKGDAAEEPPGPGLFSLPDLPPPGSGKGEGKGWS